MARSNSNGKVYLMGAGPGDPELLTLKAARILKEADTLLYDSLVHDCILELAATDTRRIFVGKRFGHHSKTQTQINELLIETAMRGGTVVRLKGGDPFVFGRGGEEVQALQKARIPFEVIPGITAANAAAALMQFPLTHRDFGQSVIYVSGYSKDAPDGLPQYDWSFLARASITIVIYMGVHNLQQIATKLKEHGMNPETPIAILSQISLPDEHIEIHDLEHVTKVALEIRFPALVIVGNVVGLSTSYEHS